MHVQALFYSGTSAQELAFLIKLVESIRNNPQFQREKLTVAQGEWFLTK